MEPYFYKSMTLIKFSNKVIPKDNHTKIKQYTRTALKNLEKAFELNPNNANLCYHFSIAISIDETYSEAYLARA